MSRTVPPALQAHLDQAATTTTRLLKVTLTNGFTYGLAMLDRTVPYDDGDGELDYIATNGFDSSTIAADLGYTVANAEGFALISDEIPGVTEAMIDAGELDDARWVCYLVNFEDLTMGHVILDAGDLGEVRTRYGMVWMPELLSYIMRLRQPIGTTWSRTCRAIFGTAADSPTGCGVDLTPLWLLGEVLSVGLEPDLIFTGDHTIDSPSNIPPGRVQFLTGNNAGREAAVEATSGATVTLAEPTTYPVEVGDTYRIRPDCAKQYEPNCIGQWDNGPNFKGEPLIPVGDSLAIQAPGGQLSRGGGFVGAVTDAVAGDSPADSP